MIRTRISIEHLLYASTLHGLVQSTTVLNSKDYYCHPFKRVQTHC